LSSLPLLPPLVELFIKHNAVETLRPCSEERARAGQNGQEI